MKTDVIITVRTDPERKARIKAAAAELGLTPSEFIRHLVVNVTDAIVMTEVDNPKALAQKFNVLADYFITLRLAKRAKRKLEDGAYDDDEQQA